MAKHFRPPILTLLFGAIVLPGFAWGQADIEVGPYVQFSGPHTAVVRWDTSTPRDSIVEYGTSPGGLTSRIEDAVLKTIHEITIKDVYLKDKYFFHVGYSDGGDQADR